MSKRARRRLGVAMIGHAFMGRAHANAMRQAPRFFDLDREVDLRVVVGRDRSRVDAARSRLGFEEASTDVESTFLRDDVDLVDIATPNDTHAELALAALAAGKHVLCEKPLALDSKQARTMVTRARKAGVRVGLWHNYRRCPAASLAQRIVARGDIGRVRQVRAVYLQDWLSSPDAPASWRTSAKTCGSGAHGDLNAHLIDLTHFLTGLRFVEVCALAETFTKSRTDESGKRRRVDVDDAFSFLARFDKGNAIGTFEATRVAAGRKNHNRIEIHGETGTVAWNLERMNELEMFQFTGDEDTRGFRTILCNDELHPYAANWWPDGHILGYEHTFVNTFADFVQSLDSRRRFAPDFEDGLRVQLVLDAAMRSAEKRRFVEVPNLKQESSR